MHDDVWPSKEQVRRRHPRRVDVRQVLAELRVRAHRRAVRELAVRVGVGKDAARHHCKGLAVGEREANDWFRGLIRMHAYHHRAGAPEVGMPALGKAGIEASADLPWEALRWQTIRGPSGRVVCWGMRSAIAFVAETAAIDTFSRVALVSTVGSPVALVVV